jgi:hypothetical protein
MKMLQLLFGRKIKDVGALLQAHYFEVKAWYIKEFDRIPCVSFIGELDTTKAYAYINEQFTYEIVAVYQHAYFEHDEKKMYFNNTVFILTNNRMLELGSNYCQVLHTNKQYTWANELIRNLAEFRMLVEKERTVIGFARQTTDN